MICVRRTFGVRPAARITTIAVIVAVVWAGSLATVAGQKKKTPAKPQVSKGKPVDELSKLRAEYIRTTQEYKASLTLLLASYQKSVPKAEQRLNQSRELFSQGLISKSELEASERALAEANDKVSDTRQRMSNADAQIANALVEAEAEKSLARSKPLAKGSMVSTTAYIRYNGGGSWALSDAWKVQRFFQETFKRQLPIAVFGQGAIHDRWRLDHHNSMDISLHPDGPEGQALLNFLRNNGIPFLAFRQAIPGTATGPHIHIGRPSHRY